MPIISSFPCPSCGGDVPETARRCPGCGHDFVTSPPAKAPKGQAHPGVDQRERSAQQVPTPEQQPPSKEPGFIIAYAVVLFTLMVANLIARFLDNPHHQLILYGAVLALFALVPYFRRILLKSLIVVTLLATLLFGIKNCSEIRSGSIGPQKALIGVASQFLRVGALLHGSVQSRSRPLVALSQALIACDSGIPSAVIRLTTLTPIIASLFCLSTVRVRRRSPTIRL